MSECELSNELGPYLDHELSEDARKALEAHLSRCAPCTMELEQLRELSLLLSDQEPLSRETLARFHNEIHAIDEEREVAERTAWRIVRISRLVSGIAACLLVAGSLWLVRARPAQQQAAQKTGTEYATGSWDSQVIPAVDNTQAETASPADASANWLVGGLVASSQPGQGDSSDQ